MKKQQELLRKRARQIKAFICYTNLIGGQDELVFDGGSMVIDPRDKTLAFGKPFEEDLVIADVPVKRKKKTSKAVVLSKAVFHKDSTPLRTRSRRRGLTLSGSIRRWSWARGITRVKISSVIA